jgi:hypothetical protein
MMDDGIIYHIPGYNCLKAKNINFYDALIVMKVDKETIRRLDSSSRKKIEN